MKRLPAILVLASLATICSALDTVTSTQKLKDRDTIFSSGGIFELGFFSQGEFKNPYFPSRGCIMEKPLICKKGDGFYKFSSVKAPDTNSSLFKGSIRLQDCKTVCLKNCSCMAFTILDINGNGKECLQWYGDLFDIQQLSRGDQDLYVRVSFSESDQPKGRYGSKLLLILTVLVALNLLLLLILAFGTWKKRKNTHTVDEIGSLESQFITIKLNAKSHKEEVEEKPPSPLSTLADATNDLRISNELEKGEVEPVFKAGKAKLGDKITALHQVVSPFGMTDTASVLWETIVYIKFLHEQVSVSVLSNADIGKWSSHLKEKCDNSKDSAGQKQDLRSRGLCLVPVSSTRETTAALWNPNPTFGRT